MKKAKTKTYSGKSDSSGTICYFDCFSGISGDMILGALIDAGLSPQKLRKSLSCLPVKGYKLRVKKVKRAGLLATKVEVKITQNKEHPPKNRRASRTQNPDIRKWTDIKKIIKASSLSNDIKQKGLEIFKRLFEAEAKVHGGKLDTIHLHELGAVDCIVDIFGTLIGLDLLGVKQVYSSPVNLGSGTVKTEHGILPVPAPATAELMKNVPVYSSDISFELTTPTGAVLVTSLTDNFGSMPEFQICRLGIGAGSGELKMQPNVLRVFIGQKTDHRTQNPPSPPFSKGGKGGINNCVTVIETNIDDMNPQIYEYVMEKLFKAGALDVFLTQVIMKKSRPGIKLTVLCGNDKKEDLMKILLRETTSIGLRFYEVQRKKLHRQIKQVSTKFGPVKVKISQIGDGVFRVNPEYEDCRKIAKKFKIPLVEIIKLAALPDCEDDR